MRRRFDRCDRGTRAVLGAGLLWAGFSFHLGLAGHTPPVVFLPIAPERYYLAQAIFVVPGLFVLWKVLSYVAVVASGGKIRATRRVLSERLGIAYGLGLAAALVIPEWLAFALGGVDGLKIASRVAAPIAALTVFVASTAVIRSERSVSVRRAGLAAFVALVAQGILGASFLR